MPTFYVIVLAFVLGFALVRAATCTVAATDRWVIQGKVDWLFGLSVVASWAAIMLFLLAGWTGSIHLPLDIPLSGQLFFGATIMGIGATINRACFIGTIGHIGTGKFRFVLSFVGLGFALWLAGEKGFDLFGPTQFLHRTPLGQSLIKQVALGILGVIALVSLWLVFVQRKRTYLALIAVGICAAVIYGTRPEWAYTALLSNFLRGQGLSVGKTVELAVVALFAGAILSSWLKDRFEPEWGSWRLAMTNLSGGFLMGIGASAVPGGNDVLLMWTIPGLTLYGVVAYLSMIATIAVATSTARKLPPFAASPN